MHAKRVFLLQSENIIDINAFNQKINKAQDVTGDFLEQFNAGYLCTASIYGVSHEEKVRAALRYLTVISEIGTAVVWGTTRVVHRWKGEVRCLDLLRGDVLWA